MYEIGRPKWLVFSKSYLLCRYHLSPAWMVELSIKMKISMEESKISCSIYLRRYIYIYIKYNIS